MDAIEFVKYLRRMDENGVLKNCFIYPCAGRETDSQEDVVSEVEQWAKDHPVKTRQSEFLKMFPNAFVDDAGVLSALPCRIDKTAKGVCPKKTCRDCRRNYWLQEIE